MMKKPLLALGAILILLIVFLTTEEKKDFLTEETYWKKNVETVIYNPPAEDWEGSEGSEFIQEKLILRLLDRGDLKTPPLFSVRTIRTDEVKLSEEDSSEGLLFEGGYNVKNLFTELSVFKIKTVTEGDSLYLKEYMIDEAKSPSLEIRDGKKPVTLYLGKETKDKSLYSFYDGKYLLSTNAHTFRRFRSKTDSFRERNLLTVGTGYLSKVSWKRGQEYGEIENSPETRKSGGFQNIWRRNSGTRLVFNPGLGNDLENQWKTLRYERFPDEDQDGIEVLKELVKLPPDSEWNLDTSEGRKYKILLFPKTMIGDKEYRPVIRRIDDKWEESPAYVSDAVVRKIEESAEKIRNAKKWQRPEKKIK